MSAPQSSATSSISTDFSPQILMSILIAQIYHERAKPPSSAEFQTLFRGRITTRKVPRSCRRPPIGHRKSDRRDRKRRQNERGDCLADHVVSPFRSSQVLAAPLMRTSESKGTNDGFPMRARHNLITNSNSPQEIAAGFTPAVPGD